ncbi:hypothetical protein CRV02_12805 [Arcobacter sp. CECT 8989]|uniref:hypothetical protein n=1 Tax=Arcobacter sp. CECT 8989 TaxID=2044509 RepID=UPI00100BD39F|nr:hypothetical protein [Arcobacter sp. CECT 8989]RXJ98925.1 hypothetical protein CRV02_12805 [Arcobacter sp. CECT 8989]
MKKSFSLLELVLVLVLVGIIYSVFLPKIKMMSLKKTDITLINLKSYLLKQKFKNELAFKCVENSLNCFIYIDGKLKPDLTIKHFFEREPIVYKYNKSMNRISYGYLKFDTFEEFKIVFQLVFNQNNRHKDLIVQTDKEVLLFNSIHEKPKEFDYLNDVVSYLDSLETEVKNAF